MRFQLYSSDQQLYLAYSFLEEPSIRLDLTTDKSQTLIETAIRKAVKSSVNKTLVANKQIIALHVRALKK